MPLKVYVAASSTEIDRAEQVMAALRAAGCEVVSTWPEYMRDEIRRGLHNDTLENDEGREIAARAMREVQSSDTLLMLAGPPTTGGGWEAGVAHFSMRTNVLVSGPGRHPFYTLAGIRFTTDAEAIEWCARRVRG